MNRDGVLLLLLCTLLPSALGVQQSRGLAPAPATGTGRIAGIVVDAKAQPVRSAVVRLTGADLPAGRATISSDDGTFVFDALPAGRFSLTSSKPAYLAGAYGAVKPAGTGTPIALSAGQQLTGITLSMPRGSVITGVVRDETGAPLQGLMVYVIRPNVPAPAPSAVRDDVYTDDRGRYRIFGLSPGTYYVTADRRSSGGIGDVGMMSASEVDATFQRLQRGDGRGASTALTERSPSSIVRPTRTFSPAPIFYPGVSSFGMATPVTLGLGEVREGIDFAYQLVSTVMLSGSVSGADTGQSVQLSLTAEGGTPTGRGLFAGPTLQRRTATGDGEFVFTGVTPGKYTLLAVSGTANAAGLPSSTTNSRFARTPVEVVGNDIGGLSLALRPTLRVSGRVQFPGDTAPTGQALTSLVVTLVPSVVPVQGNPVAAGLVSLSTLFLRPSAPVREDGTFEITGVLDSGYRLTTTRNPAGWTPKAAMLAGKDILDHVVEITTDVSGIELTMSNQPAQLSGRLLKPDNTPAPGYFVIAFTTDQRLWQPNARRLRSVRPGTDGSFRFDDLPAGEYFLAALTEADSDEWQAASFLSEVVPAAIKVTIADGEKKVQDLRIGR